MGSTKTIKDAALLIVSDLVFQKPVTYRAASWMEPMASVVVDEALPNADVGALLETNAIAVKVFHFDVLNGDVVRHKHVNVASSAAIDMVGLLFQVAVEY